MTSHPHSTRNLDRLQKGFNIRKGFKQSRMKSASRKFSNTISYNEQVPSNTYTRQMYCTASITIRDGKTNMSSVSESSGSLGK